MRIEVDIDFEWEKLFKSLKKQFELEMELNPSDDGFVDKVFVVEAIAKYLRTRPNTTVRIEYKNVMIDGKTKKLLDLQRSTIIIHDVLTGWNTSTIGVDNILNRVVFSKKYVETKTLYGELSPKKPGQIQLPPRQKLRYKFI